MRTNSKQWRVMAAAGLIYASQALALDPTLALTQYSQRTWNTEQGLPQNSVFAIRQTRDGYLWLATQEGLARFDGQSFRVFDKRNTPALQHNDVWVLHEDRTGALWIGTRGGGLARYADGGFSRYSKAEGLSNDSVQAIAEDAQGVLWIGTRGGGLSRYAGGQFSTLTQHEGLSNDTVFAVWPARDGSLWLGTDGGGLNHYAEGKFTALTVKDGLSNDIVFCIYEDRAGVLWVGTAAGLNRIEQGRITRYGLAEGLSNANIRAIYEDRAGNLWIATDGGGLNRFSQGRFSALSRKEGLSSDSVGAVYEDREGNLWVGTDAGGLNRLKDSKLVSTGEAEGLINNNVRAVFEDREGALWAGTFGGVSRYQDGRFTHLGKKDGLSSEVVLSIAQDLEAGLWFGTLGAGLNHYSKGRLRSYLKKDGLSNETILALLTARDGTLWIGTRSGGLNVWRGGRFSSYTMEQGLSSNDVRALLEDRDGSLWIGTLGGGLNRYQAGKFTAYKTEQGLAHNLVLDLYQDEEGAVWIGTYGGGLSRYHQGHFSTINASKGLFDEVIYRILPGGDGRLWFSSNRGIFSVPLEQLRACASGQRVAVVSTAYGTADGMRSREGNGAHQPAGWRRRDGSLWFPTIAGLVRVDPARMPRNTLPPPVRIEEVLADGSLAAGTDFQPGTQKFEFRYTALSFSAPERLRFEYRLEGFDEHWVAAGPARAATYTNIAPGAYVFHVRARNEDGVLSEQDAAYRFELQPRFHQRRAFLLVYLFGAAGLVWLGLRVQHYRVQRLQTQARELSAHIEERKRAEANLAREAAALAQSNADLERFAYVASHDLREPLRAIASYTQLLQRRYAGKGDADADEFTRYITDGVRRMGSIIDGVLAYSRASHGAKALETVDLNQALKQALANLHAPLQESGGQVQAGNLPTVKAHAAEMVQVLQNLISNAIKYRGTDAPAIQLSALRKGAEWRISLRDNGIGIEPRHATRVFELFQRLHTQDQYPGSGLGLAICKKIIERQGGRIWVEPAAPQGSVFHFTLPASGPD